MPEESGHKLNLKDGVFTFFTFGYFKNLKIYVYYFKNSIFAECRLYFSSTTQIA